jgi:multidrug efflux pump subunit AcrA (membrane-fusion protein)
MPTNDATTKLAHVEGQLATAVKELNEARVRLGVIESELRDVKEAVKALVTRFEFTPVKILVYGMTGTVLSSALVALLSKVIIK